MFGIFKKSKSKKNVLPELLDLQNQPILEGDKVTALRYDMGICSVLVIEDKYVYESEADGKQISWLKMIDASTDRQKVEKIVQ